MKSVAIHYSRTAGWLSANEFIPNLDVANERIRSFIRIVETNKRVIPDIDSTTRSLSDKCRINYTDVRRTIDCLLAHENHLGKFLPWLFCSPRLREWYRLLREWEKDNLHLLSAANDLVTKIDFFQKESERKLAIAESELQGANGRLHKLRALHGESELAAARLTEEWLMRPQDESVGSSSGTEGSPVESLSEMKAVVRGAFRSRLYTLLKKIMAHLRDARLGECINSMNRFIKLRNSYCEGFSIYSSTSVTPINSSSANTDHTQRIVPVEGESLPYPCSNINMLLIGSNDEDVISSVFSVGPEPFTRSLLEELYVIEGFLTQRKVENQDGSLFSKALREGDAMLADEVKSTDSTGENDNRDRDCLSALCSVVQNELNDDNIEAYRSGVDAVIAQLRSREWMYTISAFQPNDDSRTGGPSDSGTNNINGSSSSDSSSSSNDCDDVVDRVAREISFSRKRVERLNVAIRGLEAHSEVLKGDIDKCRQECESVKASVLDLKEYLEVELSKLIPAKGVKVIIKL